MKLKEYLKSINETSHFTFDPNGPGVVRVHLIPPKKVKLGISWIAIINGYDVLPITCGWAILLREFFKNAIEFDGKIINDEDINMVVSKTITTMRELFPNTNESIFKTDLKDIIYTLKNIAKGAEIDTNIGYMRLAQYAKFMRAPHRIDLMISSMVKNNNWNCNQKCMHCYAANQKLSEEVELNTLEWKKIIDKLHKAGVVQLTFTGGEPTLRNDLVDLIEYSKWFITRVNTNGIKLSKELAKNLYNASLDSIQVTVYSSNKDIHNLLVGSNHFNETIEGIKNAIEAGLNVSINTPLCNINKNYVDTIKFISSLGVRYFSCSGLIMTGSSTDKSSQDTYLTKQEILSIVKEAYNYCKENELELAFTSPGWILEKELKKMKMVVPSCGACLSNMAVAPSGDLIPCQSWLNEEGLGNLLEKDFNYIWNSKRCREIRNKSSKIKQVCLLSKGEIE